MAAIGSVWSQPSWANDVWTDGSWADVGAVALIFEDLNTVFIPYVETLRDASALLRLDSDSLVAADLVTIRTGNPINDLNTAYARTLS